MQIRFDIVQLKQSLKKLMGFINSIIYCILLLQLNEHSFILQLKLKTFQDVKHLRSFYSKVRWEGGFPLFEHEYLDFNNKPEKHAEHVISNSLYYLAILNWCLY